MAVARTPQYRDFIQNSKGESARPSTPTWRTDPPIQRPHRVLPGRRALALARHWLAHLPAGEAVPFRRRTRRWPARPDRVDYDLHARRATEIAGDCFDAQRAPPRLPGRPADDTLAAHRPGGAGGHPVPPPPGRSSR
jgi:hypothetical protein